MTNESGSKERKLSPPYVGYKTFSNFIDGFRQNGLPSRIDRSIMPNISGGYQKQLLNALEYLDFITEDGTVRPNFRDFISARGEMQVIKLQEVLRIGYPFLFEGDFLKTATTKQIQEKFSEFEITGDTLRKSVMFFMTAAKQAKIELSPYIKPYKGRIKTSESRKNTHLPKPSAGGKINQVEGVVGHNWNQILLSKFPEFDPAWDAKIQEKWFDMFAKLMHAQNKTEESEHDDTISDLEES